MRNHDRFEFWLDQSQDVDQMRKGHDTDLADSGESLSHEFRQMRARLKAEMHATGTRIIVKVGLVWIVVIAMFAVVMRMLK